MADFHYCPRGSVEPNGFVHLPQSEIKDCYWNRPWDYFMPPFRIAPHVWYVSGTTDVSSYLLDTGDGLILIDCPSVGTTYLQLESIRRAGFDPLDIKYIFITHAHGDHYAGARMISEYTGAPCYMSKEDTEDYSKKLAEGTLGDMFGSHQWYPDRMYDIDKPFELGRMSIKMRICPGHTPGTVAYFFDDKDDETGEVFHLAMHGGAGATAGTENLKRLGYPLWMHDKYIADCEEMAEMDVDIVLASHENQTNLFSGINENDRSDYTGFIDRTLWKRFLLGQAETVKNLG